MNIVMPRLHLEGTRKALRPILALSCVLAANCPAISVFTTDFIADGTRTYFNGFEGMPFTSNGATSYTEDSIRVDQVNGLANGIATVYSYWGAEGSKSWYPNGGDLGYTRITLTDGSDFGEIGFLRASGNPQFLSLFYELYENGALVMTGSTSHHDYAQYLGFSGSGFDEIRVRDGRNPLDSVGSGTFNALAIDSIEVRKSAGAASVPDGGSTLTLMGCALAGLGLVGRKRIA